MMRLAGGLGVVYAILGMSASAHAGPELKLELNGYWRVQAIELFNLMDTNHVPYGDSPIEPMTHAAWFMQRLRLDPKVSFEKLVKLQAQVDILDDVVWGDNEQQIYGVPLFAERPSNTNWLGQSVPSVDLKRAWLELNIPVGLIRVGRQPSNWGLGILSNDGNGFTEDFGEKHFGSTFDRVAFATKPLSIYRTIKGAANVDSNFIFAYAYDKLSEEPCLTNTTPTQAKIGPDCTFLDPDTRAGKFQAERPFASTRWLEHDSNDVQEHIFVLYYNNEKWHPWRLSDQLKIGTYIVLRTQAKSFTVPIPQTMNVPAPDNGAFAGIYDGYYKLRLGPLYSEAEGYIIKGHASGAIPLGCPLSGSAVPPSCEKNAFIIGAVWRAGYMTPMLDAIFEFGYSSGDDDLTNLDFTQRPLHPDYKVGLMLFPEVMRERTYQVYSKFFGNALQSLGGVVDAYYLFPRIRYRPPVMPGLEGIIGVVAAWRDQADEFLFTRTKGSLMGVEVDAGIKYAWAEDHLNFKLEGGVLFFGDALSDYASSTAGTIQSRLAFLF
jgi:hypothetical protein